MRNSKLVELIWFCILWKLKAELVSSSPIKLLGFFPDESSENLMNDLFWIRQCRSMFRSAILLSQQSNITFQGQYLSYEEILTDDEILITFSKTCSKVLTSNIVGFVGPVYSYEAKYLASFAYRLGIIDVSYSATSSDLSTIDTGAFYRISPSDKTIVLGLKALFRQLKWKSCIIIYQNDEYGYNGMYLLSQTFNEIRIKTFETIKFGINQQDFSKTLRDSLSRIVIVWANELLTRTILHKAIQENLIGKDFVWILTTTVSLEDFNKTEQEKLEGILTIEPFQGDILNTRINRTLLEQAYQIWKSSEPNTFPGEDNVSIYALFAFDATWSLILSLKQLCSNELSCLEFVNISDCYNRRFLNSKQYFHIMKTISFLGVSGRIQFSNGTPDRINNLFYLIKNVQSSNKTENQIGYVPVLQWNVNSTEWTSYKNESIDIFWPNRSKKIPIDHKSIEGQQLRIAIIESPPSIILKSSSSIYKEMRDNFQRIDLTDFDGFYKDLILYLQEKMRFIPIILVAKPTIRYDQLVEGVAHDSFDVVMSSIDINAKRNQIVDFSIAILPASYRIVVRKTNSIQSDYLLPLRPFLWLVWLFLLIIIPYTNMLIWCVERKNENSQNETSLIRLIFVINYQIYSPFGRSNLHIKSNTGRFLTSILSIFQMLLLAVHTVGLLSFLIIQTQHLSISGIDDIKNGKIPANRIGILVGSQIEEYYLNSISQGNKDYFPLKTLDEVYTRLIQGDIDASLWSNISTAYHINNIYCNLMTVGLEFSHSFYQIPVKHGWLYTADLNFNILSFMESEQLDRISAKWFGPRNCSKTNLFPQETTTVAQTTLTKVFITIALISIISILPRFCPKIDQFTNRITRLCRKNHLAASTTSQFVLIDLSSHLNELSLAMLDTLCLLAKDTLLIFEDGSAFNFDELPKKSTILFVSSQFATKIKDKPEQVDKIFILEEEKNRVDHRERFETGEDLIYQLADEIYRCYDQEARAYSKSGDQLTAKFKKEQANRIHNDLKKVHQRFSTLDPINDTSSTTVTTIIWLTSKFQDDNQVKTMKNLFFEVVSSFSAFDNLSDCHEYLLEHKTSDHIFLITDVDYQDSVVAHFQQLTNVKVVARYGQASLNDDTLSHHFNDLCSRLTNDLIVHYNKLGTDYSIKQDSKTAKDMFIKASKLCHRDFQF